MTRTQPITLLETYCKLLLYFQVSFKSTVSSRRLDINFNSSPEECLSMYVTFEYNNTSENKCFTLFEGEFFMGFSIIFLL